jgi:HlyD family secretion protein
METSILEQSRKSKGINKFVHKWKILVTLLIVALLAYGAFSFFGDTNDADKIVEKQTYTVKSDDIKISIETDGKVVAEDGVELSFNSSGTTIAAIYVNEGDYVTKGDKIAKVDTTYMEIDLASAYAGLKIAKANLLEKEQGATGTELALAAKAVEQAELNLAQIREQNEVDIARAESDLIGAKEDLDDIDTEIEKQQLIINQSLEDSILKVNAAILTVNNALVEVRNVLESNNRSFRDVYLGALDSQSLRDTEQIFTLVKKEYQTHNENFSNVVFEDEEEVILENLASALALIRSTGEMMSSMTELLNNTISGSAFTQTELDNLKNSISNMAEKVNIKEESLVNAKQSIDSAKLEDPEETLQDKYDDAILNLESVTLKAKAAEEDAILQLETANLQLDQKSEITATDLTSLKAQVDQAQYRIDKLLYDIQLATLYVPIDGEIAQLNGKVDEYIVNDNTTSFATILNKDTFYIEVYIEEMDINKINVGQKIYATFDAIEGAELTGEVSYVSLTSKIDNSGIVTYLVRILLDDTKEIAIREGMTTFVEFVISEINDILVVPVSAVVNYEGKPSVQMESGEWINILTGFTDGSMVEIIDGLKSGDKIYKQ